MKKAFTLIEILVVIAIIGILAALVTASFVSSQRQARDTNRKSDLSQYRTSLESYANINSSLYPVYATAVNISGSNLCGSTVLNLSTCLQDPKNGTRSGLNGPTFGYYYQSDAGGIKYILYGYLENVPKYWIICSTGISTTKDTTPTIGDCP